MRRSMPGVSGGVSLMEGLPAVYHQPEPDLPALQDADGTWSVPREKRTVVLDDGSLQEETFIRSLVWCFDQVLTPAHVVVRDLDAYFDPDLCPADYLEWLASWLGVNLNARWPIQRRRALVKRAIQIHMLRGTVSGVAKAVELYTGSTPEVEENGGAVASLDPAAPFPGSPRGRLRVRVETRRNDIDREVLDRIIRETKPAHIPHELELIVND